MIADMDKTLADLDAKIAELTERVEKRSFWNWFKRPKVVYREKKITCDIKKTSRTILNEAFKRNDTEYFLKMQGGLPHIYDNNGVIGLIYEGSEIVVYNIKLAEDIKNICLNDPIFIEEYPRENIKIEVQIK